MQSKGGMVNGSKKLRYANKDLLHNNTLSITKPTPSALGLSLDQLIAELQHNSLMYLYARSLS